MPIIKSAKKALRQNKKNRVRNQHNKDLYTQTRKAFEDAIDKKDVKAAQKVYQNQKDKSGKTVKAGLQANIDKLVKKNIIHPNTAARRKSVFVKMMKELS